MGFRFIVLTYPHTHTHISWQSDRNIGAVYYVVGADKNQNAWSAAYSRIIWWMSIKCYDAIWIYRHFFTFSSRVTLTFAFMDPKSIPECLEVVTCTKISDHRYHRFWLGAVTDGRVVLLNPTFTPRPWIITASINSATRAFVTDSSQSSPRVPYGSGLGASQFIVYTQDTTNTFPTHNIQHH